MKVNCPFCKIHVILCEKSVKEEIGGNDETMETYQHMGSNFDELACFLLSDSYME